MARVPGLPRTRWRGPPHRTRGWRREGRATRPPSREELTTEAKGIWSRNFSGIVDPQMAQYKGDLGERAAGIVHDCPEQSLKL